MKKVLALLTAAALVLSLAACKDKDKDEDTTTVPNTAVNQNIDETTGENDSGTTEDASSQTGTTKAGETTTANNGTTGANTPSGSSNKPTSVSAKKPSNPAEIVSYFNSATQKVASAKPGFKKVVKVEMTKMKPSILAKIGVVRETVEDFAGAGTTQNSVSKGQSNAKIFKVSALTASDVSSASCTENGNNYVVTLKVKGGTNPEKGKSSIGRLTNDYKSRSEIIAGLAETDDVKTGPVEEVVHEVTVKATINKNNQQMTSYTIDFSYDVALEKVKYLKVPAVDAQVAATGSAVYSSFAW